MKEFQELLNPELDRVDILEEIADRFLDMEEKQRLADALMTEILNYAERQDRCPRCLSDIKKDGSCARLECDYEEGE